MRATGYLFGSRKLLRSPALSFYLGDMPYLGSERMFLLSKLVSVLGFFSEKSDTDSNICAEVQRLVVRIMLYDPKKQRSYERRSRINRARPSFE